MSSEQQIARFCQGLNSPLDARLEAMRPTSIQDALIRAKPLVRESGFEKGQKRREPFQPRWKDGGYKKNATNALTRDISTVRCFECKKLGHYQINYPDLRNRVAVATTPNQGWKPRSRQRPWSWRPSGQDKWAWTWWWTHLCSNG